MNRCHEVRIADLQNALDELLRGTRELLETTPEDRQNPSVWYPRVDKLRALIAKADAA